MIELQRDVESDALAILTLDRPPVNALSQPMWDELSDLALRIADDPTIRALVIAGANGCFAAGADVSELVSLTREQFDVRNRVLQGAFHAIATLPQITVAAIDGYALGGGCELALAADFRFASPRAKLGLPEVTLGIIPGSGGTQRLPRLIGVAHAKEMILTGRVIGAAQAEAWGLVDRITSPDPLPEALQFARQFVTGPSALRHAKRAIDEGVSLSLEQGLALEADLIAESFATKDGEHGLRSFVENGPGRARFTGE